MAPESPKTSKSSIEWDKLPDWFRQQFPTRWSLSKNREMSDSEVNQRLQRPHLLEHPDEITPEFLREWIQDAGEGQSFTGNFHFHLGQVLLGVSKTWGNIKEEDIQQAVDESRVNLATLKKLIEDNRNLHIRSAESANKFNALRREKKRVPKGMKEEVNELQNQSLKAQIELEIAVLPVYKKLRALGYDSSTLSR